jgi:hypothetical protein
VNTFQKALQGVENFFRSGKATAALEQAAALVTVAAPIVQELEVLVPTGNRTVQAVEAAYAKYAVPVAAQIQSNPTSINNALLNLASQILAKNLPPAQAGAATNVLNTAVQLAVTAARA